MTDSRAPQKGEREARKEMVEANLHLVILLANVVIRRCAIFPSIDMDACDQFHREFMDHGRKNPA